MSPNLSFYNLIYLDLYQWPLYNLDWQMTVKAEANEEVSVMWLADLAARCQVANHSTETTSFATAFTVACQSMLYSGQLFKINYVYGVFQLQNSQQTLSRSKKNDFTCHFSIKKVLQYYV